MNRQPAQSQPGPGLLPKQRSQQVKGDPAALAYFGETPPGVPRSALEPQHRRTWTCWQGSGGGGHKSDQRAGAHLP